MEKIPDLLPLLFADDDEAPGGELAVIGNPHRNFEEAAAMLLGNPAIASVMVTHRYPLDAAAEAFAAARDRSAGAIKVVFDVA